MAILSSGLLDGDSGVPLYGFGAPGWLSFWGRDLPEGLEPRGGSHFDVLNIGLLFGLGLRDQPSVQKGLHICTTLAPRSTFEMGRSDC